MRAVRSGAVAAALVAALGGCGGGAKKVEIRAPSAAPTVHLSSSAFRDGATMPKRFTCAGAGTPPPLAWSGVPRRAAELVLVLEDPDAPGGTFTHWTVFGVPPGTSQIRAGGLPAGASSGRNGYGKNGYGAPCPPSGDRAHRYVFTLYALSRRSGLAAGASPAEVKDAVSATAAARGRLTTTYRR